MGFSLPKHGFESRYRNQEGDTAQGANIWGLKGSVAQPVVHFAVNKKVDGSIPSTTVFLHFFEKIEIIRK